jgi:hypothetical protein
MSSPSPVTDGKSVCVMTGTGISKASTSRALSSGRAIFKSFGQLGYASSPLLWEALSISRCCVDQDDPSYVLRLDSKTGDLWKVERKTNAIRESPDSYSTPALLRYAKSSEWDHRRRLRHRARSGNG